MTSKLPGLKKLFGVGMFGAFLSLVLLAVFLWLNQFVHPSGLSAQPLPLRIIGILLMLMGLCFHFWSFFTLRNWWVHDRLCTSGPFRYVRHPMYAAWITLVGPGLALLLNSWILLVWAVLLQPLWHVLVRREEAVMIDLFGEQYREMAARTGRFIPRLFW
jgi:protein-S-isoprenylcysteine O-methyltransferase Ste14